MSVNKSPKKIYDWIKYNNIKDATINNSALKGLKRVNKIVSRFLKFSFFSLFVYFGYKISLKHYEDVFHNNIKNLEKSLNLFSEEERKYAYLNNHIKLSLEYGNSSEMNSIENKTGIAYYREKLLQNAKGLVLETCCGSFRNKDFYGKDVSNVNII